MTKKIITLTRQLRTESDTLQFAAELAGAINSGAIIFLNGPLGAGKTTFARGFLQALGYLGKVKSPTYTIVEPYDLPGKPVFHFDFYRLKEAGELEFLGIEEYFIPQAICLIEWPEKGFPLLPEADLDCYIDMVGDERQLRMEAYTMRGKAILTQLGA